MAAAVLKVLGIWLEVHVRGSGEDQVRLAVQAALCDLVAPETLSATTWFTGPDSALEQRSPASPQPLEREEGGALLKSGEGCPPATCARCTADKNLRVLLSPLSICCSYCRDTWVHFSTLALSVW